MNRKLLFFDLDGTLLPDGHGQITPSAAAALRKAQANGHLVFVNSGRPMGSIGENVTAFPFDGYICGCGTHIVFQGKEMQHVEISRELIYELIRWNEKEHIDIFFEGEFGLMFPPEAEFKDLALMEYFFTKQGADVHYYNYDVKSPEDIDFHVDKFSMWYDPKNPPVEYRKFLEEHFDIIQRSEDFWEVVPKGYTKASGIDEVVRIAGGTIDDTISFGDSYNDVSMLEHTKESVLMGNGFMDLSQIVTYVTDTLENDGIAKALAHFGLV